MDSQTETENQSVPPNTEDSEPSPDPKKVPFGLALVIVTLLVMGLLVISSYLWSFFNATPDGGNPPAAVLEQTQ